MLSTCLLLQTEPLTQIGFALFQELIREVTSAAEKTGFPLFVVDTNILQCFLEKSTQADRSKCSAILQNQTAVQFGSLGQYASQKVGPYCLVKMTA